MTIDSGPTIPDEDSLAITVVSAVRAGDVARLEQLLTEHPELARARIVDRRGIARSLLHVATDWPGHFPNVQPWCEER
jgi:hypothetical protein